MGKEWVFMFFIAGARLEEMFQELGKKCLNLALQLISPDQDFMNISPPATSK